MDTGSGETTLKLYVVRHAIAEDRDPDRWPVDGQRPLSKRGRRRFAQAAKGLVQLVPNVDLVLSSPHVRAWETATILHQEAGWPEAIACDALRSTSPEEALHLIQAHHNFDSLALVGHEPQLSLLISTLVSPDSAFTVDLKKGAVACLDLPADATARPSLLWLRQPKALRELAQPNIVPTSTSD